MNDHDSNDPTPEQLASLDRARSALAQDVSNKDHERAFWEVMFGLDRWHFLTTDDPEALASGTMPALLTLTDEQGRRMAPVFSSSRRAGEAQPRVFGDVTSEEGFSVVALPTDRALAYLCAISADIPYVLFDHLGGDGDAYGNESRVMPGWYDQLVGPCPIECLAVMSKVAGESGHPGAFVTAYRSIVREGQAFYVRTSDGQIAIANEQGTSFLPVFSTFELAQKSTEDMEGVQIEACPPGVLGTTHDDLKQRFEGENFMGVVFDPGRATLVLNPELFAKAMESLEAR